MLCLRQHKVGGQKSGTSIHNNDWQNTQSLDWMLENPYSGKMRIERQTQNGKVFSNGAGVVLVMKIFHCYCSSRRSSTQQQKHESQVCTVPLFSTDRPPLLSFVSSESEAFSRVSSALLWQSPQFEQELDLLCSARVGLSSTHTGRQNHSWQVQHLKYTARSVTLNVFMSRKKHKWGIIWLVLTFGMASIIIIIVWDVEIGSLSTPRAILFTKLHQAQMHPVITAQFLY